MWPLSTLSWLSGLATTSAACICMRVCSTACGPYSPGASAPGGTYGFPGTPTANALDPSDQHSLEGMLEWAVSRHKVGLMSKVAVNLRRRGLNSDIFVTALVGHDVAW
eukprot:386914-Pyramimonas_sp.AAC.1